MFGVGPACCRGDAHDARIDPRNQRDMMSESLERHHPIQCAARL